MKATGRTMLPLLLVVLVFTPISGFMADLDIFQGYLEIIPGTLIVLYVLSLIALMVITAVMIVVRFYKNLVTSEGYLMHTLPVKVQDLILSKLLASMFWTIVSVLAVILSILLFVMMNGNYEEVRAGWNSMIQAVRNEFGTEMVRMAVELCLGILIGIATNVLFAYASIAIGQTMSSHKIVGAIGAGFGLYMISQMVSLLSLVPIFIANMNVNDPSIVGRWIIPSSVVMSALMGIALYIVTHYILKKKLNLE